ncbi:MAG: tryptophan synthase subunit alpha [Gemmataceae bacterium]|nr:tryptophan synthase subunit alpha [Gemmataceae bacterium]
MNPIDALFQRLRSQQRKAFIPFFTAGDPDLETTAKLAHEVARHGASLIEIGFPYSDPIADGAVIQASYTRALNKGLTIDQIFALVRQLVQQGPFKGGEVPLAGMVSYSLVHHRGPDNFLAQAAEAGLSGVIVPDLPIEEAAELARLATARDVKLIQLVTPTTPRDRATRIARMSTGFLYCVSVVGITGERQELPAELLDQLCWLRTQTDLPLCVGFGVSKPEHVRMLKPAVDGVIVGSAIVRRWEQIGTKPIDAIVREIGDHVELLSNALAE